MMRHICASILKKRPENASSAERFVDEHLSWITEHHVRVQARRTSAQRLFDALLKQSSPMQLVD
ncbi:MAG: hypothetical protein ACOX4F_05100 [Atopobiaceae bacterium]|jgi:tRNA G26 N,N-dimethylase Trm1